MGSVYENEYYIRKAESSVVTVSSQGTFRGGVSRDGTFISSAAMERKRGDDCRIHSSKHIEPMDPQAHTPHLI